jgi:PD-(D/E)XK nuclease superfamily
MNMPPWTYSRLGGYETCPKQFYHLKVAKDVVEPETVYTQWGHTVHTAFENSILNPEVKLPEGMTQWQPLLDKFLSLPGAKYPEFKFSVSRGFQPAEWDDSWSRGIADLLVIHNNQALVADWKTGKKKPTDQLALYAAYTFHYYPEVETVHTNFVWLKSKEMTKNKYERKNIIKIWDDLLPRARKLEMAYERDSWPARPSGLCNGWCQVKSCTHYKEKR